MEDGVGIDFFKGCREEITEFLQSLGIAGSEEFCDGMGKATDVFKGDGLGFGQGRSIEEGIVESDEQLVAWAGFDPLENVYLDRQARFFRVTEPFLKESLDSGPWADEVGKPCGEASFLEGKTFAVGGKMFLELSGVFGGGDAEAEGFWNGVPTKSRLERVWGVDFFEPRSDRWGKGGTIDRDFVGTEGERDHPLALVAG